MTDKQIIYVLMGNDFPSGAYTDKELAIKECEELRAEDKAKQEREPGQHRPIWWKLHAFEANGGRQLWNLEI